VRAAARIAVAVAIALALPCDAERHDPAVRRSIYKMAGGIDTDTWRIRSAARADVDGDAIAETVVLASSRTSTARMTSPHDASWIGPRLYDASLFILKGPRVVYEFRANADTQFFYDDSLRIEDITGDRIPEILFTTCDDTWPNTQVHILHYDAEAGRFVDLAGDAFRNAFEFVRGKNGPVALTWRRADSACHMCGERLRVLLVRWNANRFDVFATVETKVINDGDGPGNIEVTDVIGALRDFGDDFADHLSDRRYLVVESAKTQKHCFPLPADGHLDAAADGSIVVKKGAFSRSACPPTLWEPITEKMLSESSASQGMHCTRGSVAIGAREVPAYLVEQKLWSFMPHDGIFIDLDADGTIEDDEYFGQDDQAKVDGRCLAVNMDEFWQ